MPNEQDQSRPILLDTNVLSWLTDARNPRPEWESVARDRIPVLAFVTVGEILHATADTDFDEIAKRFPLEVVRPTTGN